MKKICLLFMLISSLSHAQYTVNGTMTEVLESDWILLYKIESTQQIFVANTTIKKDSLLVDGKKVAIGNFRFTMPKNAKIGSYRATYKLEGAGFVDFIFNKENVTFTFNPRYPEETTLFSSSKENIIYKKYLEAISAKQQKLDSIQIAVLRDRNLNLSAAYKKAFKDITRVQKNYLAATKSMYIYDFIKATLRKNSTEIINTPQKYMSNRTHTFFDPIDFSNTTLINSSFLTTKITDYIFYLNSSDNKETQNKIFKNSIETVLSKITKLDYKRDIIAFLVAQFESTMNLEIIDYLLEANYKKLPLKLQNKKFLAEKNALFATEIGRTAPDFSWTENGKKLSIANLTGAENYILFFGVQIAVTVSEKYLNYISICKLKKR